MLSKVWLGIRVGGQRSQIYPGTWSGLGRRWSLHSGLVPVGSGRVCEIQQIKIWDTPLNLNFRKLINNFF